MLLITLVNLINPPGIRTSKRKTVSIIFIYLVIVVHVGLRWETGTDWNSNHILFNNINMDAGYKFWYNYVEIGYTLFVFSIKKFNISYSGFLLLHAITFYLLIFKGFRYRGVNFFTTLLFFYSLTAGMIGSNRQLLALAIVIYAIQYLLNGRRIPFVALVILASFFHLSALIAFAYLFMNQKIESKSIILVLTAGFVLGITSAPSVIYEFIGNHLGGLAQMKYEYYSSGIVGGNSGLTFLGLFKRVGLTFIFIHNRSKIIQRVPNYDIFLNGYLFSIIIYALFASTFTILISRGSLYFTFMEAVLLSAQVILLENKYHRYFVHFSVLILAVVLFIQSIAAYPDLFIPYKSLLLNINPHFNRYLY